MLREFVVGLVANFGVRLAAEMCSAQREAFRKFAKGITETPQPATRKKLGEAYLRLNRGSASKVREAKSEVPLPTPEEFRLIFKNRDDALRKFAEVFARVPPGEDGEPPVWARAAHVIMRRLANAAFAAEAVTYAESDPAEDGGEKKGRRKGRAAKKRGSGPKKKGEGGAPPKRSRRPERDDGVGGEP